MPIDDKAQNEQLSPLSFFLGSSASYSCRLEVGCILRQRDARLHFLIPLNKEDTEWLKTDLTRCVYILKPAPFCHEMIGIFTKLYQVREVLPQLRARWTEAKWHSSGDMCRRKRGDEKAAGLFHQPNETWERGILCLLDLRQIFPCAWKKYVPTARWKISAQRREIWVEWFLHGCPSAQVQPGDTHNPLPTACSRSVRIFKGRNQICLLVSLTGTGSRGTAAVSSCSGGIGCSHSHSSSSSPLGRRGWAEPPCKRECRREVNLTAPWEGGEGEFRARNQWRLVRSSHGPWASLEKALFLPTGLSDLSCICSPAI